MNDEPWLAMDQAALDAAYDNFGAVADAQAHLDSWAALGARMRAMPGATLDLAYGPRPRNRIDHFACGAAEAPLLAFVHGGYWQRNAKEPFACMAQGPLAHGLDVATIGYTLAPEANLTEIAAEVAAALRFLRDRLGSRRLVVSGWSAGAHLAAHNLTLADAGLVISGIYDLAPIRATRLNDKLALTEVEVREFSPVAAPPPGPLVIAFGEAELPELCRQSQIYHAARHAAGFETGLLPIAGADHFSVLDGLIDPAGALTAAAIRLAGR